MPLHNEYAEIEDAFKAAVALRLSEKGAWRKVMLTVYENVEFDDDEEDTTAGGNVVQIVSIRNILQL